MTAILMVRLDDRVVILSDGALYRSTADFTLTGFRSKVRAFSHLNLIIGSSGFANFLPVLEFNFSDGWRSFDHFLDAIQEQGREVLITCATMYPGRATFNLVLYIAGWSDIRQRFETYILQIIDNQFGEVTPAHQVTWSPNFDPSAMEANGFDPENISFLNDWVDPLRFIKALRASPQIMGNVGDDADSAPTGSVVGGFVERSVMVRDGIQSQIIYRWPDEIGKMIDPTELGCSVVEPTTGTYKT